MRSTVRYGEEVALFVVRRLLAVCFLAEPFARVMASGSSVHSAGITEVHKVPINVINRPIPPVLEEEKVKSLMKTIQVRNLNLAEFSNVARKIKITAKAHSH